MAPGGTFPAFHVASRGADFERIEKPLVDPGPGHVRVKVHACGLCHSDCYTKLGLFPGVSYPRTPGHEVAGEVDAVGEGVTRWKVGDRVGVGWFGGGCHECTSCREGDFVLCDTLPITGITYDGGYQQFIFPKADALAAIPDELSYIDAAPLLCAGVTVFNGLRRTGVRQGGTVGVQGIGGLGHLAIQYASKMGYRVFAFSRGRDKEAEALRLGATHYFDTTEEGFVQKVQALGGVNVLMATSTSPAAMSAAMPTLAKNGTLLILGAGAESVSVDPGFMIGGRRRVMGNPSGQASDSEDALKFAVLSGVRPIVEVYPISAVSEAYERTMSYKAIFRVVLNWDQ